MEQFYINAIDASIKAGEAIMKIYRGKISIENKEDESPLTLADQRANNIICSILKDTNIPIISEENIEVPYEVRRDWSLFWMVDPLDGTKEFINRNGEFTVNIALIEKNKPILGIIYVPVQKTLYLGNVKEQKALKLVLGEQQFKMNLLTESGVILNPWANVSTDLRIIGSRSHPSEQFTEFITKLTYEGKVLEIISCGSSLKFCKLAEGKANVYPRLSPTMEWDTAAGHAICNAVGIEVKVEGIQNELEYNKKSLVNPNFIASF